MHIEGVSSWCKAMDRGIVVSEFVLHSRYYVHFRANTLGKGMNPLILPAMGYIVLTVPSWRMALALNNLQGLICHKTNKPKKCI